MLDYNFHITTPRLYLTYLDATNAKHLQMLYERFNHPEKIWFKKEDEFTLDSARRYIAGTTQRLESSGWGRWVILLRPADEAGVGSLEEPSTDIPFSERSKDFEPVGVVSMQYKRFEGVQSPDIPDVGFGLLPREYGKGYATEAALGLMRWTTETKGFKAFAGFTDQDNEAAKKALKRLGMREVGVGDIMGIVEGQEPDRCVVFVKGLEGNEEELNNVGITLLKDL